MSDITHLDRLRAFDRIKNAPLFFPAFKIAHDRINAVLEVYRKTGVIQNLVIVGDSGNGKSTLAQTILRRYPKQSLPERDIQPAIYARVPPAATISGAAEAILTGLNDPSPTAGSPTAKTDRICILAKGCGVELLLIDEAQHLYDRGQAKTHYHVGDWIKSLTDRLEIPIVLIGLSRTEHLLQANEQIRRRFTEQLLIGLPTGNDEECWEASLRMFVGLCDSVGATLDYSLAGWTEWGERLWYASGGRVGYLSKLLLGVLIANAGPGTLQLRFADLEASFSQHVWRTAPSVLNPFSSAFQFRALTQAGEPFGADVAVKATKRGGQR